MDEYEDYWCTTCDDLWDTPKEERPEYCPECGEDWRS